MRKETLDKKVYTLSYKEQYLNDTNEVRYIMRFEEFDPNATSEPVCQAKNNSQPHEAISTKELAGVVVSAGAIITVSVVIMYLYFNLYTSYKKLSEDFNSQYYNSNSSQIVYLHTPTEVVANEVFRDPYSELIPQPATPIGSPIPTPQG